MISERTLKDYAERASILTGLFLINVSKTKDLVVEDFPVDFATHKFICSVHRSAHDANILMVLFAVLGLVRDKDDVCAREYIEELHSLEEKWASQNEFLEKFVSTHTVCALTTVSQDNNFLRKTFQKLIMTTNPITEGPVTALIEVGKNTKELAITTLEGKYHTVQEFVVALEDSMQTTLSTESENPGALFNFFPMKMHEAYTLYGALAEAFDAAKKMKKEMA